jgi:hypothetical protein
MIVIVRITARSLTDSNDVHADVGYIVGKIFHEVTGFKGNVGIGSDQIAFELNSNLGMA